MYFITELLDFCLPRICPSCNNKLKLSEECICISCLNKILCADTTRINYEYQKKFKTRGIISGFTSLFVFEKDKELQRIIHSIKYGNNFRAGESLGKLLGDKLLDVGLTREFDLIIPVPLHQLKKAERGYNQSYYISRGVNRRINKVLDRGSVKRIKFTETQTSMNIQERERNIKGAFKVNNNSISGKNILIVDDVITSGNTVSELGRTLKNKGAGIIYAASIAIAD
jgi:competence protein ComFC